LGKEGAAGSRRKAPIPSIPGRPLHFPYGKVKDEKAGSILQKGRRGVHGEREKNAISSPKCPFVSKIGFIPRKERGRDLSTEEKKCRRRKG